MLLNPSPNHVKAVATAIGRLVGDRKMRGVSKEVVLDVEYVGQAQIPWRTTNTGF